MYGYVLWVCIGFLDGKCQCATIASVRQQLEFDMDPAQVGQPLDNFGE